MKIPDKITRWTLFRWSIRFRLADVRDWFLRFIYAQHNARVILDFEDRMCSVIYEASGGMMSKSYYDTDVMLSMIREHVNSERDDGYSEGRKDLLEELGVPDPQDEEGVYAEAVLAPISEALGLFASVIKSGESWTATCQAAQDRARETLALLTKERVA